MVHRWSQSFNKKTIIGPDGQVIESESRTVCEPDGTEVRTTVERSPQGERKRIVRRTPTGEEEVQETDTDYNGPKPITPSPENDFLINPSEHSASARQSSGLFESIRRWFRGSDAG
ncbi:hypothetical protein EG68_03475 [Paragonimus skrjabini miyazakii]|uniref:Uncharacterized protein n=1 Tax=Paragonimus skrjabini miyazakii TaxID=59628 RepID=A0A8S9Z121_9TREM|nr:hypothetical protein EG68_03475 [Paragonimus skrjabini miyazakii]